VKGQPRIENIGYTRSDQDEDKQNNNTTQNNKQINNTEIVLSVLLRFTSSDYLLGIIKLVLLQFTD